MWWARGNNPQRTGGGGKEVVQLRVKRDSAALLEPQLQLGAVWRDRAASELELL